MARLRRGLGSEGGARLVPTLALGLRHDGGDVETGLQGASVEERSESAEELFDETVKTLFGKTHPLIRTKFETHEHIPFFNIYRARTGQQAARMEARRRQAGDTTEQDGGAPHTLVESTLVSTDERVIGRPDVIDAQNATIVEYKTGGTPDGETPTDSEMRQLRLYAFVAEENGIAIRKGIIERNNGDRDEAEISQTEAETEGRRARETLDEINRQAGRSFKEAATPSGEGCRYCPCISFCPPLLGSIGAGVGNRMRRSSRRSG